MHMTTTKRIASVLALIVAFLMVAVVPSSAAVVPPERPTGVHAFDPQLTGRVKVDRCIRKLQAWGRSDDDVQMADRATVECSAIVKDKDARELARWINGTGRYSSHKWAWALF